ncbi:MAG: hypothetical protein ACLFVO_16690 [Chloroflexaceae bacterium]
MGKKKKKQKSRSKQSPGSAITALVKGLQRAEQLMNQADWDQAQETLLHLNQRHPNQFDVLYLLMAVAYERQDMQQYQQWGEQLHRLDPDNPETTFITMPEKIVQVWCMAAEQCIECTLLLLTEAMLNRNYCPGFPKIPYNPENIKGTTPRQEPASSH